jgi:hypothetical protein
MGGQRGSCNQWRTSQVLQQSFLYVLHFASGFSRSGKTVWCQTFVLEGKTYSKSGWFDWLVACCLFGCGWVGLLFGWVGLLVWLVWFALSACPHSLFVLDLSHF